MSDSVTKWMDFPGLYEITASVFLSGTVCYSVSFSCEEGGSCVFGLLLDKGGARTIDNEITVAPVTAAYIPYKRRRRSCKIFKDVR